MTMGRLLAAVTVLLTLQETLAQPSPGPSGPNGPPPVKVTLHGTLSLTGNSYVTESQEALRGLQLGVTLQSAVPLKSNEQELDVQLDIRDDQGDPELCRSLYESMVQSAVATEYQIFLGPISQNLSEVAANVTLQNARLLILPFTSLPAVQAAQETPAMVFSLEVLRSEMMKVPVFQVAQAGYGAKTFAIWSDVDPFYANICDGAAAEAVRMGLELVFQRDVSSHLFLLEQARQMAAARPDLLVVCQEYQASVEVMLALDFIHFQPNALLIWDSANSQFYEPLLVAGGIDILGVDVWSPRYEPCGVDCVTITRAEFFQGYQNLYNTAPSIYAGQAAAAAIAVTYLESALFSPPTPGSSFDEEDILDFLTSLSSNLREDSSKVSFYHPLTFNQQGYMASANVEVTQLSVLNFTSARRLQNPPSSSQQQGQEGQEGQQGEGGPPPQPPVLVEPVTTEQLSAFTTLQPTLRGVYVLTKTDEQVRSQAYTGISAIVYPRRLEETREVLQYPCSLGFEVRAEKLWGMINIQRLNRTGGPVSPCEPCDRGFFRSQVGSACSSCPAGTQATSAGQSECTECLQGTLCHPAAVTRTVAPGFHEAYGLLFPCAVAERCLGENECLGNSQGVLCADCNAGYVSSPDRARVEADPCRPCLGALIFAAHPIHIENIVYLVGRADALSTTFYLLALIAYQSLAWRKRNISIGCYILLAVLNVLSGLCKEPGFTCLFYLFCVEAYQRFDKILNGHGIGLHDGNDFLWMTDLGYLMVRLGSDAQGANSLQEGLRRMPYSSYAWNALGIAQARQGQLSEALESLGQGLQVEPENHVIWSNMAAIYAYGQAPEQALQALREAIRLNATHPAVAHNAQALASGAQEPILEFFIPYPGRGGR